MSDEVVVTVETPEVEPVVEPPVEPVVVVVEPAEPEATGEAATVDLDHEHRLTVIETGQTQILAAIAELAVAVQTVAGTAVAAEETAHVAVEIAAEAADEGQAEAESDDAPDYEHPFYRQRKR